MKWQPSRLRVWHEMLMDYILLHPRATRAEIAEAFSICEVTVTNLTTTDLFRLQLERRRERMELEVEGAALTRLREGVGRLAEVGVERLTDAVVSGEASLDGIRDTTEMALRALGYGQGGGNLRPSPPQTTVIVIDKELLAEARAAMRGRALPPTIEVSNALPVSASA